MTVTGIAKNSFACAVEETNAANRPPGQRLALTAIAHGHRERSLGNGSNRVRDSYQSNFSRTSEILVTSGQAENDYPRFAPGR
jgi:hypothetical protein